MLSRFFTPRVASVSSVASPSLPFLATTAALSHSLRFASTQKSSLSKSTKTKSAPTPSTSYQLRRSVLPLQKRFDASGDGGLANPEVPSAYRAIPLDFNVIRQGTTLRIKWKVVSLISPAQEEELIKRRTQELEKMERAAKLLEEGKEQDHIEEETEKGEEEELPPHLSDFEQLTRDEVVSRLPQDQDGCVTTTLTAELMRVCALSTDVLSLPDNVVVSSKKGVTFEDLHLVGNYALRIQFSDGHTAGIYGYQYLFDLSGIEKWPRSRLYLQNLRRSKRSRHPPTKKGSKIEIVR